MLLQRTCTMATTRQKRIDTILGEHEPEIDRSLRGQALRRASGEVPPRTLTAWEWEEWYARHGVPDRHREGDCREAEPRGIRGLLSRVFFRRTARGGTATE